MRKLVFGLILGLVLGAFGTANAASIKSYAAKVATTKITVNGLAFKPSKPIVTINKDTYVALSDICSAFAVKQVWNEKLKQYDIGEPTPVTGSVYSIKNPAPLKISQVVKYADYTYEDCKFGITVNEVIRGEVANSLIKQTNQFNAESPEGYEYLMAKIDFKALIVPNEKAYSLSSMSFKLVSEKGKTYEYASAVIPEPKLDATLYEGSENEGWAVFLVAKNDAKPKIVFGQKYDGSGGTWFRAY